MNSDIRFFLKLLGAVISGEELPDAPAEIDWNALYAIAARHNVLNILAYGAVAEKYGLDMQLSSAFLKAMYEGIRLEEQQEKAFCELFAEFEKHGIDYMPLKGNVIKKIYAQPDMRRMSDADVLIRKEQTKEARAVMDELGYEFILESNHEFNYRKPPCINVELHKHLVPDYNDDLYAYYGDGWRVGKQVGNTTRYEMSNEDFFIYTFIHFAKHYRDAGVGIKHILDIWLYPRKVPDINMDYVYEQFEKLNVKAFFKHIQNLTLCWFEDGEFDDMTKEITKFILTSGEFGSIKNNASSKAIRDYMNKDITKAKKYRFLRLLFPGFQQIKESFPMLRRFPALLPVMWIIRLIKGILFKRDNISYHKGRIENIDEEYIKAYIKHMDEVGLDIYNGRKKK